MLGDVDVGSHSKIQEQFFPWFVEEAHKNNCKVHGLAFTQIEKHRRAGKKTPGALKQINL